MRFIENGPSIPDELLNARDQGRVVFFCGAGVSQARAGMPNFFDLAQAVIRLLGASEDSDACKLLAAREVGDKLGITGLISADRVFGLLEREFTVVDIQAAVARCLAPKDETPDISAHQLLLRLATTPDSKTQLVTTNFDRLFDECKAGCQSFQPPRLPDLSCYDDLDGIVYLHGRVNDDYTGAERNGLVLSSSDFGYAYLSEGWATEFFRDIVRKYVVVFIGYSADDPPIHYLLEGFRRTPQPSRQIYAFQADESDEALARWRHKGVDAIPYAHAEKHSALWETLEQWAERADDPGRWQRKILSLAMAGPEKLQPHQRGQVAHIVSTYEGARDFAESPPPAEWLCVFDPSCRYGSPGASGLSAKSPVIDPFIRYGLDSDTTPERSPDGRNTTREPPAGAWDAFIANRGDGHDLSDESQPSVRGNPPRHFSRLPRRLECLGIWIAQVVDQPAAVWWTARQKAFHPSVRRRIKWQLQQRQDQIAPVILTAWRYLLEAQDHAGDEPDREWYELKREIEREGWGAGTIRWFSSITCPFIKADRALMSAPAPPEQGTELHLWDLVRFEVECPARLHDATIPDAWLERVIRGLRKNLELAVQLHQELDQSYLIRIGPIVPDDRPDIDRFQRQHGLSGCVIKFAALFERLMVFDISKAQQEVATWPADDEIVFARLRFWAGGKPELASADTFCQIVGRLSDDIFWNSYHQRDLLLVLAARWRDLSAKSRKQIEDRLLAGPARGNREDDSSFGERKAWAILERLQWLADNNCEFSFNVEEEITRLRPTAPRWEPKYAKGAAESLESRGGWVRTNTEHGGLLRVPISSVLSKALESSGQTEGSTLEERDPFAGLCADRPVRAIRALSWATRQSQYPEWAWSTFLNSPAREKDKPRFSALVAERLCRLPDEVLIKLLYPATWWLRKAASALSKQWPKSFDKTTTRLIEVLILEPSKGRSNVVGTPGTRDWVTEAINSPAGHLTEAIFADSRLDAVLGETDLSANWLMHLARLLALKADPRRFVVAIVAGQLGWLHCRISHWTEQHVLSILDADDEADKEALWDGFLWNPVVRSPALYLRLKHGLPMLVKGKNSVREGHLQSLAVFSLSGWITSGENEERLLSNDEFRDMLLNGGDDFRSHILWEIGQKLRGRRDDDRDDALAWVVEFFRDVWPRQRAVKNPTMSARLCELLLSDSDGFARLVDVVLPFLTKVTRNIGLHLHSFDDGVDITRTRLERLLAILYAVLPDEISDWPFGIAELLEKIGAADNGLLQDARFRDLTRRWNAR